MKINYEDHERRAKLYDLLEELAGLNFQELEGRFSTENINALKLLADDILGDENCLKISSPSEFVKSTNLLHKTHIEWAQRWTRDASLAWINCKNGNKDTAIAILDKFLIECPSPFLKEVVRIEKESYQFGECKKE